MWPAAAQPPAGDDPQAMALFAHKEGIRDILAFVATVRSLRETGHLPDAYVTKEAAEARGWHGGGLCSVLPGHAIGGDLFRDLSRQLPEIPGAPLARGGSRRNLPLTRAGASDLLE